MDYSQGAFWSFYIQTNGDNCRTNLSITYQEWDHLTEHERGRLGEEMVTQHLNDEGFWVWDRAECQKQKNLVPIDLFIVRKDYSEPTPPLGI